MTEYYPGSNIGLNYNAEEGTWKFSNQPQDFIDSSSFSTPEPSFPTAPTNGENEEEQEEPDTEVYEPKKFSIGDVPTEKPLENSLFQTQIIKHQIF